MSGNSKRRILVVSHVAREEAIEAAMTVLQLLDDAGVTPVLEPATYRELLRLDRNRVPRTTVTLGDQLAADEVEIAIVLGETARSSAPPNWCAMPEFRSWASTSVMSGSSPRASGIRSPTRSAGR